MPISYALHDAACVVLRVALAVVFAAHGWQKIYVWTIDGTAERFGELSMPSPDMAAPVISGLELVGGILLGLGLVTRLLAIALATSTAFQLIFDAAENAIQLTSDSVGLSVLLIGGCVAVALLGPGEIRIDRFLSRDREDDVYDPYDA